MSFPSRITNRRDSNSDTRSETNAAADADATDPAVTETALFRLGRVLFGGILAFNAIDNLRNLEDRIGYAEFKGAPEPERTVPTASVGLLFGGLGIVVWRLPTAAAAAIAGFLAGTTPVMHDFWNEEEPEQQQQELIHFLKNTALFGAALAFLKVGQHTD